MTASAGAGRFAGRLAVVTGGGRGMGLAICRRLAAEGARVVVNDIVADRAESAARDVRDDDDVRLAGGDAEAVAGDVSDPAAVDELFARAARGGPLHVLVNNAAVPMVGRVPFFELTHADWELTFAVNARGTYLCTLAAARRMADGGAVVNLSSIGATRAHRSAVAYDASKGAIEALTRATALELAPYRIRVNAVAPGAVADDRFSALSAAVRLGQAEAIPLGRAAAVEEVAAAVAFLASDDAGYTTGQVLGVDGGLGVQARQPASEVRFDHVPVESIPVESIPVDSIPVDSIPVDSPDAEVAG